MKTIILLVQQMYSKDKNTETIIFNTLSIKYYLFEHILLSKSTTLKTCCAATFFF